jgi:TPR repeat protein
MRDAPVTVVGVLSPTFPRTLSAVLATVLVLALLVGAAYGGQGTRQQQAVPQNTTAADGFKALQQRAEHGDAEAQVNLGVMYEKGNGVPQDYSQAAAWYRKAAEQGDATAQGDLGTMYFYGKGVPQDYIESHKWLNLAASRMSGEKQKDYAAARDVVAEKMTPAQLAEAQKRASEWLAAFEKRKK